MSAVKRVKLDCFRWKISTILYLYKSWIKVLPTWIKCLLATQLSGSPLFFPSSFRQPLSNSIMKGRVAEGRLQVLQIYRLLQCVHEGDKEQIEKMVKLGVENLINLTEPKDGTGVLHVAVSHSDQGDKPLLLHQIICNIYRSNLIPPQKYVWIFSMSA